MVSSVSSYWETPASAPSIRASYRLPIGLSATVTLIVVHCARYTCKSFDQSTWVTTWVDRQPKPCVRPKPSRRAIRDAERISGSAELKAHGYVLIKAGSPAARERRDVKYNEGAQLDPSQMGGGRGRGGKVAIGGGAGLIVLLIALLFGINPGDILGGAPQAGPEQSENPSQFAQCTRGSDINADRDCRFVAYTNSIQDYWKDNLQGYQTIQVVTFTDSVNTACGHATSAVGPFYCPADTTVYLDLGFFDQLMSQLGAQGGDAAEAYVLAHEFGHHVQNLLGTMQRVQSSGQRTGPTSPAVRLELQADCYAGVWFKHATEDPQSPISEVTEEDLRRAVDAAQAVGDDRIQEKMQGQVSPETWTHGSAAMRREWLAQGFNTGDPNKCDTFARNALN
jgi:uncharacterized protein